MAEQFQGRNNNKEVNKKKTMTSCISSCIEKLPQRWVVTVMGMLGVTMLFTMRSCLSITITQMVMPVSVDTNVDQQGICPMPEVQRIVSNTSSVEIKDKFADRFQWDEETQGMILAAFYYGYIVTPFLGGYLSQKFGGKFPMAYAILSTSTLTLLTPFMARMGPTYLMVLRFIEGLGEGLVFPALCTLLAQWAPPLEKGKFSTLVLAGVPNGIICANLLSAFIIYYIPGGWPNVFYIFGTISLIWLSFWVSFVYNDPHSHPFISAEECKYLHEKIGSIERDKNLAPTPWKALLLTPAVWALVAAEIGFDWGAYTIVNDLPKYMNDVLHFSMKQNSFLSSTPYFAQWIVSITSSILADYLIKNKIMTVTLVRKIYTVLGTIGPGLGAMCASFVGCNKFMAIFCFTLGMALMGLCYPSIRLNALDLSPNYSASIMALINGLGCLSGMISPYIVGLLTPNRTIFEWRLVFWIMLITMVSTSIIYSIFGSGKLQSWDSGGETQPPIAKNKSEKNGQKVTIQIKDLKRFLRC